MNDIKEDFNISPENVKTDGKSAKVSPNNSNISLRVKSFSAV